MSVALGERLFDNDPMAVVHTHTHTSLPTASWPAKAAFSAAGSATGTFTCCRASIVVGFAGLPCMLLDSGSRRPTLRALRPRGFQATMFRSLSPLRPAGVAARESSRAGVADVLPDDRRGRLELLDRALWVVGAAVDTSRAPSDEARRGFGRVRVGAKSSCPSRGAGFRLWWFWMAAARQVQMRNMGRQARRQRRQGYGSCAGFGRRRQQWTVCLGVFFEGMARLPQSAPGPDGVPYACWAHAGEGA